MERSAERPLRRWLREHAFFLVALTIGAAVTLPAMWIPEQLHAQDHPAHAGMIAAVAGLFSGDSPFDDYYVFVPDISTYLVFYVVAALLSKLIGIEPALRVLYSLYVVGTPAATAYLLHALGRSPWPALLLFGVVYNLTFYMGFGSFLLGIPLAIWALAALVRALTRDQPSPTDPRGRRVLIELCVASTLAFFTHALAYFAFALVAGPLVLLELRKRRLRMWALAIVAMVPSAASCLMWMYDVRYGDLYSRLGGSSAFMLGQGDFMHDFPRRIDRYYAVPMWLAEAWNGDEDMFLVRLWGNVVWLTVIAAIGGAIVELWLERRRLRANVEGRPPVPALPLRTKIERIVTQEVRALLVFGLLQVPYWTLPEWAASTWLIYNRMVLFSLIGALVLLPRGFSRQWVNALVAIPALVIAGRIAFTHIHKHALAARETAGFDELIAQAKPGQRVYGLLYNTGSDVYSFPDPYAHYPAYYMAERGGFYSYTFVVNPSVPLRPRRIGTEPIVGHWAQLGVRYDLYGDFADYFVVHGPEQFVDVYLRPPPGVLRRVGGTKSGWSLWENTGPRRLGVYSFFEQIHRAHVSLLDPEHETVERCGSYLSGRHQCGKVEWRYVGPIQTELAGVSVNCLWAHPADGRRLAIEYDDVPAEGNAIRGFAGVVDDGQFVGGSDVRLDVRVDGRIAGGISTGANPGYQTFHVEVPPASAPRHVTFEVTADSEARRHFCFYATLFESVPEPAARAED